MGPSRADGPSAGPAEANGLPEAHRPLKSMGPGVIVPPAPLSVALGSECPDTKIFKFLILKHDRANVNVESEESMGVMMKCNTVTSDGL